MNNRFTKSKNIKFCIIFLIFMLIAVFTTISFQKIYAELQLTKSIEIFSEKLNYQDNEPGAWKVTKSAKWTKQGEAEITFDLDSILKTNNNLTDILFVLDISGSMSGEKLERVKKDTTELIESLLSNDKNRAGLITFDTESETVSDLTNDKNLLINKINNLEYRGSTNYYQALVNVDTILKNYKKEGNRECVVLFLTDGYPNEDTPNEVGQYNYLKSQYPYVNINAIQYEMGFQVLDEVKNISDNQFIADMYTLNNVLFDASITPITFDNFKITDYIDKNYFYVEDEKSIIVSQGKVEFDKSNQIVDWILDSYKSGSKATMTIKAKLKENLDDTEKVYPTNEKEEIISKIEDVEEDITSKKTPVLADNYRVIYDGNTPSDCGSIAVPETKNHSVFETVAISDEVPVCNGYQFKGWKIGTKGVEMVNDDYFIMPESDVEIKGTWSKLDIRKSMNGTIKESLTMYKQVQQDFNNPNKYVKKYTGDTSTFNGSEDVYYYYGEAANNNVVFANYCWKIVRTTDTGGVKIIYNGIPSAEGKCDNTGDASQLTAEQMNLSTNKVAFNKQDQSLADVGYMYNNATRYISESKDMTSSGELVIPTEILDPIEYNVISNESTQQFTYDEAAKKWISNNHDNASTSLIRFSINNAGTYYLDLEVSSEANYDKAIISVDGEEKIQLSGIATRNLELKNLEASSVVEVKYTKDGSSSGGTDNVMFSIGKQVAGEITDTRWIYGNSFEYNETTKMYTLKDYEKISFLTEPEKLGNRHYTCFDITGVCEKIAYIYHRYGNNAYYIELVAGKNVGDALNEMLYNDDVNKDSSTIKTAIDYWYENNMTDYTQYLEDTVWCNNRTISNQNSNGWNPNGGSISTYLSFFSNGNSSNLICQNKNDRFTVSLESGNGALTYPVGLIMNQELNLAYVSRKSPLDTRNNYWSLSPQDFGPYYANNYYMGPTVVNNSTLVAFEYGVRPAVSLRAGIEYTTGDGSVDSPYVIDMDIDSNRYNIYIEENEYVALSKTIAYSNETIRLRVNSDRYKVKSFKMNGKKINGDNFAMPRKDVEITDIELEEIQNIIIESEHNPYPNSLGHKVYGEKTFSGATSITVELDYETESINYDYIYFNDDTSTKYGGKTRKTETITIPGDYIKIIFKTDGSGNNYYGFKATITPNYE